MHEMNDACLCSCKCNAIKELNTWGVTYIYIYIYVWIPTYGLARLAGWMQVSDVGWLDEGQSLFLTSKRSSEPNLPETRMKSVFFIARLVGYRYYHVNNVISM
jgi:hypothetical protein